MGGIRSVSVTRLETGAGTLRAKRIIACEEDRRTSILKVSKRYEAEGSVYTGELGFRRV